MPSQTHPISFQSYAYQLRKKLLKGVSLKNLLDIHHQHQQFLDQILPEINQGGLSFSEQFAWKFIRDINILDVRHSKPGSVEEKFDTSLDSNYRQDSASNQLKRSIGLYQDLLPVVQSVQKIWFPEMKTLPKVIWLKQFSTRKLAHYAQKNDEIAFSLIFDFLEVPAEILSYLAYHELLHRQIGTKQINGRQFAHTSNFKNQEHLFPNWRQIDKLIEIYITSTSSV